MPDLLIVNEAAPAFQLPADNGEVVRLSDYRDRQPVLVFFYPGDFTPVCTAEVCAFRDDYDQFRSRNIAILGISSDPVEKHRQFAAKCQVPFRLLSDTDLEVARKYGARGLIGTRRAYYLIDRDGILLWQHAEVLPIFRLCNQHILDTIDKLVTPARREAINRGGAPYIPPPHL